MDSEELKKYMTTIGDKPYSQQEWDALMSHVELTADGDIEIQKFVKVLMSR